MPLITRLSLLLTGLALLILAGVLSLARRQPTADWMLVTVNYGAGPGQQVIYLVDPTSRDLRPLTLPLDYAEFQGWSPDGTHFVFTALQHRQSDLYIAALNARQPVRLTNSLRTDTFRGWSPDSAWLYYNENLYFPGEPHQLYRIRPDGSQRQLLTGTIGQGRLEAWSPDGEWLIIEMDGDEQHLMYRMRPDGSDVQPIVQVSGRNSFVAWSPDGEWMIVAHDYTIARDLYRLRPGETWKPLTDGGGQWFFGGWSPDGQWMALVKYRNIQGGVDGSLWVMRPDGTDQRQLVDGISQLRFAGWSPDSEWLLYAAEETFNVNSLNSVRLDGSAWHLLNPNLDYSPQVSFSPDGAWVYFEAYVRSSASIRHIYRARLDGSDLQDLTPAPGRTAHDLQDWSPDGTWLIFASVNRDNSGFGTNLYRMRPDGRDMQQITALSGIAELSAWPSRVDTRWRSEWVWVVGTMMSGALLRGVILSSRLQLVDFQRTASTTASHLSRR